MPDIFEAHDKVPEMLIADDDPAIVRLHADRCMKIGFKVETATNGMQLLIKARRSQPGILIVDINMPELDGRSVCSHLLDPGSKPLEVVVVTGSTDPETEQRSERLSMFYGRKGPDFWHSIEGALVEIYPNMADKIGALESQAMDTDIPQHPRVLVVDDDPDIENFLASDGDAQYLLYRLRSSAMTADIPVFVISARKLSELTEQTLRRSIAGRPGAAQIFRKSFDTEELFNAMKKFCGFEKHHA
jgi:CheY-like chemotaxis protein